MNFASTVTMLTDKTPDGWQQNIGVEEYAQLDDERKNYYSAIYAKYKTKKYRDYGEYGEYLGWASMQVGVGEPIGYKYHGVITAKVVDSVLNSNVLMDRILKKDNWTQ